MHEKSLEFVNTMSIATFKRQQNIEKIKVFENPQKKGQLLMADDKGDIIGSVSSYDKSPVISKVLGDNGHFFMMHN